MEAKAKSIQLLHKCCRHQIREGHPENNVLTFGTISFSTREFTELYFLILPLNELCWIFSFFDSIAPDLRSGREQPQPVDQHKRDAHWMLEQLRQG